MSKVDALRAMREAKYARAGAPPLPPGAVAPKAPRPITRAPAGARSEAAGAAGASAAVGASAAAGASAVVEVAGESEAAAVETGALCGHRNMGGKSCSRPAGHSEKNHRYAAA